MTAPQTGIFDFIGIGFGPAGIALATAIEDAEEKLAPDVPRLKRVFFERAATSAWQPDMLLAGTDIQHHFLRDFATPRNPRSRFTFPCYLKEKGRLFEFGLLNGFVSRIEWADYVLWVANQVNQHTRYRHEVLSVEPGAHTGPIKTLMVRVRDMETGQVQEYETRNVVVSSGRVTNIPEIYRPFIGSHVFHSHYFLNRIGQINPQDKPTFAVIGSGQNAAEILLYLCDHFPESNIWSIGRNSGFRSYDYGHFSNEVYFPPETIYFHSLTKAQRKAIFEEVKWTNYSSIDLDVSKALYLKAYDQRISGENQLQLLKRTTVTDITQENNRYALRLEEIYKKEITNLPVDVVVLCTGFYEEPVPSVLKAMTPYLTMDADEELLISREYQVVAQPFLEAGIYLNGLTEKSHGINNATSFSMMALKAQQILEGLYMRAKIQSVSPSDAAQAAAGN